MTAMTNDQILSAARSDINRQIAKGTFTGQNDCTDNEENFHTITSLYAQWSDDSLEAENVLWRMFEEEYPQYF